MVPTLFEVGSAGRRAIEWPRTAEGAADASDLFPPELLRQSPLDLPSLSQPDIVRHFTRLSHRNASIDAMFYPLGSCTMKHNPKVHETIAALDGFKDVHPLQPEEDLQGTLGILWELGEMLKSLTGMAGVTLQPAAGAHGEWTRLMMIRAYYKARGQLEQRRTILVPDTAHGTNPASAVRAGFQTRQVPSDRRGRCDLEALTQALGPDTAGIMITNPNTLGLFEDSIATICDEIHRAGGLVYMDGANFNAIVAQARPGDFGVDAMHINLHKTFSTPHGGGGPGSGPVVCSERLVPHLPVPQVVRRAEGTFHRDMDRPHSIGRVRSFLGNAGAAVRAWAFIRTLGLEGIRSMSSTAVLNANYLLARLRDTYDVPYGEGRCMHEFVIDASRHKKAGARAMDIAKGLLDRGVHPPTTYFPLVVPEALMIEPTETESRSTLDAFADAMIELARLAETRPVAFQDFPATTPVSRPDEATAARRPILVWNSEAEALFGREERVP